MVSNWKTYRNSDPLSQRQRCNFFLKMNIQGFGASALPALRYMLNSSWMFSFFYAGICIKILSLLNIWKFKKLADKASQKILYFFRLPRSFTVFLDTWLMGSKAPFGTNLTERAGKSPPCLALQKVTKCETDHWEKTRWKRKKRHNVNTAVYPPLYITSRNLNSFLYLLFRLTMKGYSL